VKLPKVGGEEKEALDKKDTIEIINSCSPSPTTKFAAASPLEF